MDSERKAFVKTDGRSSDQTGGQVIRRPQAPTKAESNLEHESESIVVVLPC